MTYFTIITGIATLISLYVQVSGLLPNYKRCISHATILLTNKTTAYGRATLGAKPFRRAPK